MTPAVVTAQVCASRDGSTTPAPAPAADRWPTDKTFRSDESTAPPPRNRRLRTRRYDEQFYRCCSEFQFHTGTKDAGLCQLWISALPVTARAQQSAREYL